LAQLGKPHVVNPRSEPPPGTAVGVLTDPAALHEAVAWRRGGRLERLVAGPNVVVLPRDAGGVIASPEVDLCLLPSEWVRQLFEKEEPALAGRTAVWCAGVDADYWAPRDSVEAVTERHALLYLKQLPGQPFPAAYELQRMREVLERAGFTTEELIYGRFRPTDYRSALWRADIAVFVTPTETQSLAQAEAWASDVPTFVWRVGSMRVGERLFATSSAPYLTDATGRSFGDPEDLAPLLETWTDISASVAPRAWVLENMTDAVCASRYLDLIGAP
jgi:hypothetical protein